MESSVAMASTSAALDAAVVGAAVEVVDSRTRSLSRRRCCRRVSVIVEAVVFVTLVAASDSVVVVEGLVTTEMVAVVEITEMVVVVEIVVSVRMSSVLEVSVIVAVVDGTGQWRAPKSHPAQMGHWLSTIACACAQASTAPLKRWWVAQAARMRHVADILL